MLRSVFENGNRTLGSVVCLFTIDVCAFDCVRSILESHQYAFDGSI